MFKALAKYMPTKFCVLLRKDAVEDRKSKGFLINI